MPIDTSIYSNLQQPKIDSPLNMLAQVSQVKALQNQNRLADLAYGQKQKQIQDQDALSAAYKNALSPDGTIDRAKLYSGIANAGQGQQLPAIQKSFNDADTAALARQKAQIDAHLQTFGVVGQIMSGVKDQATYDQARQQIAQILGPQAAAQQPAVYDPAVIEQARQKAMSVKDQMVQASKALELQLSQQKFAYQQQNDAANRGVTLRGQNMTDARAREAAAMGKVPAGYRQNPDGSLVYIPGGPADPNVKSAGRQPTEFQGKSAAFGARAEAADKIISNLAGKYSPAAINSKMSVESTPLVGGILGAVTNKMALSPADQRAEQAQRDFINAVLRQESGASIAPSEFDNAKKQYFPQPGDSTEVIAQKARNRQIAIEGFKNSAGSAAFAAAPPATAPVQAQGAKFLGFE